MKNLVKQLGREIENNPSFVIHLTAKLGYRSSNTIWHWVKKGKIPSFRAKELKEELQELRKKRA